MIGSRLPAFSKTLRSIRALQSDIDTVLKTVAPLEEGLSLTALSDG
jgi:hypothetical protein